MEEAPSRYEEAPVGWSAHADMKSSSTNRQRCTAEPSPDDDETEPVEVYGTSAGGLGLAAQAASRAMQSATNAERSDADACSRESRAEASETTRGSSLLTTTPHSAAVPAAHDSARVLASRA